MDDNVLAELAPTGVLRAAVNTANVLLVKGRNACGDPEGVAPDLARAISARLGVPVAYVLFGKASLISEVTSMATWDISMIGREPAREHVIAFTAPYAGIEATYLVPSESKITTIADVDRPGVRISVASGSAFDLFLTRTIVHARLVRALSMADAVRQFVTEGLEALAGLRPGLLPELDRLPNARVLDGMFTMVSQAVGTARGNGAAVAFLEAFVEEAKRSGLVSHLIQKHGVSGLSVA